MPQTDLPSIRYPINGVRAFAAAIPTAQGRGELAPATECGTDIVKNDAIRTRSPRRPDSTGPQPTSTVGHPSTIVPPCAHMSPIRAAG